MNKFRTAIQSTAEYGEGWADAQEGWPCHGFLGRPYIAGWFAFHKAKKIFETQ